MNNHINDISNPSFSVIRYISFYHDMQLELTWLRISSNSIMYIVGFQCGQLHECVYLRPTKVNFSRFFWNVAEMKYEKHGPTDVILGYYDIQNWKQSTGGWKYGRPSGFESIKSL